MKCKKCGGQMRILTYSTLLTSQSNCNEARRMVYGKCENCETEGKWREVFTLSSTEEVSEEGVFFI